MMTHREGLARPHPLEAMPSAVLRSPLAMCAYDRWMIGHNTRATSRAPQPGDPTPMIRVGLGVWYRLRIVGDPTPVWLRCHVMRRDDLSSRWLVVNIDSPGAQWYCSEGDLWPRYAGEIGPGCLRPGETYMPPRFAGPFGPGRVGADAASPEVAS